MTNRKKAFFFGLAAVGIWSTVASAFKISLRYLDPLQLLLFACMASVAVLAGVLFFQNKLKLVRKVKGKELLRCGLLGALNPFLYYVILFKAYDLLPAQEAQPINYTWAITLSLLSIPLLKQKLRAKDIIAILISYMGVLIISTHGEIFTLQFSNTTGVELALGSTVIWALYWIFSTRSTLDPTVGLFLNFLFGLPLILVATVLFSDLSTVPFQGVIGAVYVGFFEMGITFALWLSAMKYAALPDGGGTARVAGQTEN